MNKKSSVLDFCAGSGGKSLAIADVLSGIGQIHLYDTRKNALIEAKKRMLRAGYQNFTILESIQNLNKKFDYLLLDVPCSGSGTYKRNPDLKHKFNKSNLNQLTILQRKIVRDSIRFLKPDGYLVYVTCSLFEQENMEQVYQICQNYGMEVKDDKVFQILPESNQMDSLFQAILKFK